MSKKKFSDDWDLLSVEDLEALLQKQAWTFAKTMPKNPHWYIVRRNCDDKEFRDCFMSVRHYGEAEDFHGRPYTVYRSSHGYKYWNMGAPLGESWILNRKESHVY